ncbi:putative acetyltransferase At3g50280 [Silene latifolia]|uniref:putative acetyltransferase At3g50280 n=1 Tax=Silene latifolia TaxID=37657 RepID=UPI003D77117D
MVQNYYEEIPKIKLISECFVKPTHVGVANGAPNEPHYLRTIDLITLTVNPMQKGLLFDTKPHNLRSHFLPNLKKSLAFALNHFYTLSGQLVTQKFPDEHACCLYVDCNSGPGARFIHACVEYRVSDIVSSVDVHPIVASFFDLGEKSINSDGHTRPLLSVQVTELLDGIFIGFTMNHCLADGTSLWHFISTLSEIFGQLNDQKEVNYDVVSITKKPIFKTLFFDHEYGPGPIPKLPYVEPNEFKFRYDPGPLRVRIFHFSSKSISMLKAQANEECGLHNNISSFQALCGLMWRSITRSRNLRPDYEVKFAVAINARPRLDPPLSPEYFRSFYVTAKCVYKAGDLLSNGLGQAALLINQIIKMYDDEGTRRVLKQYEEQPSIHRPVFNSSNGNPKAGIFIAGSSKFDTYGPEFGLGRAIAVLGGYVNMDDGKLVMNPGRDGDGSVDVEVVLKPETMNALELDEEFMSFTT